MTDSLEITVNVPESKKYVLNLKTADGEARVTFRKLRKNEHLKALADARKGSLSFEAVADEQNMVLSKVLTVENLFDDGEPVTAEALRAGTVESNLADAVIKGFWGLFSADQRRLSTEAEPKNEERAEDSQDDSRPS